MGKHSMIIADCAFG